MSDQAVITRGDAARKMVRHLIKAVVPAGGSWPEGLSGPADVVPAFYWIRVDNTRSAAGCDILVSLDGPIRQAATDAFGYWDRFNAGERRVRNIGKPGVDAPAKELHLYNLGAVQATVWIELDLDPIVDVSSTNPERVVDANGNVLDVSLSSAAVKDISAFNVETTVLLGASATFTGPLRDTLNYNWFGAKSNVSGGQAGTLFMDESSAGSGANIYQAATQAAAAEPATHGAPATVAATSFGARIVPTKALLRFMRVVYVNGAVAQTGTFEIQSSMSPLN